jgi:(E)-4-hydroxy-3-methylbut-2-enyl-diphosphate synthase
MQDEFGECYPLHLGVTEAGDGEDGRIKSAMGIGSLLEDGLGDTIRVSLTEEPEYEIPVCRDLIERYTHPDGKANIPAVEKLAYDPFSYRRRDSLSVLNIGSGHPPVVVADYSETPVTRESLSGAGYYYLPNERFGKWQLADAAADYIYTSDSYVDFLLPETLRIICNANAWEHAPDKTRCFPLFIVKTWLEKTYPRSSVLNFISVDAGAIAEDDWVALAASLDETAVLCMHARGSSAMAALRQKINALMLAGVKNPVILCTESFQRTVDKQLIHFSAEAGSLLLDGMGDGVWLKSHPDLTADIRVSGRTYMKISHYEEFLNNTAFSLLQATRTRISKTEYISCPSCGRTLFDLQQTTEKIRSRTNHLKGVKIAIMGCIVNGPGEMADADFGYVGSGPGKITLYKGRDIIKRNVPSETAVDELISLLKENGAWVEPS